jgi:Ni,Fe-hydrogenase III component G
MGKNTKLQELITKRNSYKAKLIEMYKHFHGVKHESAHSELQYSEIKVYEDMLNSVVEEIKNLKLD